MQSPTASDWAAARGEKWLAQLGGIEAMNAPVDVPLIRALNQTVPQRRVRQIARLAAAGRLRRHRDARLARQVPNRRRTTAGGGRDFRTRGVSFQELLAQAGEVATDRVGRAFTERFPLRLQTDGDVESTLLCTSCPAWRSNIVPATHAERTIFHVRTLHTCPRISLARSAHCPVAQSWHVPGCHAGFRMRLGARR